MPVEAIGVAHQRALDGWEATSTGSADRVPTWHPAAAAAARAGIVRAGSRATGLDQVPESLFPLLACRNALALTAVDIVAGVVFFFVGEVLLSLIVYRLGLRDRPY